MDLSTIIESRFSQSFQQFRTEVELIESLIRWDWSPQQISLYDVIKDPTESRDVILDHPIISAELAEALAPFKSPNRK